MVAVYMAGLLVFGAAVGFGLVHVASGQALGVLAAVLALVISAAAVALLAAPHRIAALLRKPPGQAASHTTPSARPRSCPHCAPRCAAR